jgi:hypothetical protein
MFTRYLVATPVKPNEPNNEQTLRCTFNTTFNAANIEATCLKQPVSDPGSVIKSPAASPLAPA